MTDSKIPLKSILDVFGGNAARLYGLRVHAAHNPKHDHEYEAHHRPVRAAHDGQSGVIVYHHDSHELCFDVDHGAYPFVSWELDELHVELKIDLVGAGEKAQAMDAAAVLKELDERLRRDRKWIREAEEFAPREGAQYVDGLRSDLRKAMEQIQAGDVAAARLTLRGEEDDLS